MPPPATDRAAARTRFGIGAGRTRRPGLRRVAGRAVDQRGGDRGVRGRAVPRPPRRRARATTATLQRRPGPHYDLRDTSTPFGEALPPPTSWSRAPAARSSRSPRTAARRCSSRIRTRPPTTRPRNARWMGDAGARRGRARRRADAARLRREVDALMPTRERLAAMAARSAGARPPRRRAGHRARGARRSALTRRLDADDPLHDCSPRCTTGCGGSPRAAATSERGALPPRGLGTLEIGAGTGLNVDALYPDAGPSLGPDRARGADGAPPAASGGLRPRSCTAGADARAVRERLFEPVVSTLVLCTVSPTSRRAARDRGACSSRGAPCSSSSTCRAEDAGSRGEVAGPHPTRCGSSSARHPNRDTAALCAQAGYDLERRTDGGFEARRSSSGCSSEATSTASCR